MSASADTLKSTNDRFTKSGPTGLRLLFRALTAVSPALAGRLATRLFFTPPRAMPSARTLETLATGVSRRLEHPGGRLSYWTWGPAAAPSVYLLHGWGGIAGQLGSFVAPLVERGHRVIALDAPGHGSSSRGVSSLIHFSRALRALAQVEGAPHAVIAHSLGGAACAHAMREGLGARGLVFVGTPAEVGVYFTRFLSSLGVPSSRQAEMRRGVERRFGFHFPDLDVATLAPRMDVPLLVLHDRGDEEVAWSEGAAIVRAWPGATLVTSEGLGHRRILRDAAIVRRAVEFVDDLRLERSTA